MKALLDQLRAGCRTESGEETIALGKALAAYIPENTVLALYGDLGSGKTTFIQGLAQAWGITQPVTSPTYNLFTTYRGMRNLLHLDAYRVEGQASMDALLLEEFLEPPYCLAVEWPEHIEALLPEDCWKLELRILDGDRHEVRLLQPSS